MTLFRTALLIGVPLFASAAWAQEAPVCTAEDGSPCETGPCPLQKLPYEDFIAAPPSSRGDRNVPPVSQRPFNPDEGDRVLVRGFTVEGVGPHPDQGVTPETVQAAAHEAFMRETGGAAEGRLTVGHMARVADAVTTFYRSRDFLVARAFLPAQEIGPNAVVRIRVLEGRISEVVVEGAKRYNPEVLKQPSRGLVGTTPTRGEVETALLYTQDYPGVQLFGTFKPGAQLGDTKLVLQVQKEDRFDYSIGADNYGNDFTGKYRFRTDVSWNNPFGNGDEITATIMQAVSPANTTFGSLGYRVPVGPRGLSAYASASHNDFAVKVSSQDLAGAIDSVTVGADWKFVRERFRTMKAGAAVEERKSDLVLATSTTPITNDQYRVLNLQFDGDFIDTATRGVNQFTGRVRQSVSTEFGNTTAVPPDSSFTVLEARYVRVQALTETQTGVLRTRLQQSSNLLSPLEQFPLAGPDVVRAYPVGQALADSGAFASAEYRVQAPGFARAAGPFGRAWGDLLTLLTFVDYATGKDNGTGGETETLSGFGAGIQFAVPGTFQFLVQGAKPISSVEASDGDDFRLYGEFSLKF